MLKKLGKRIINNVGLKIIAVMAAVSLWIFVGNIDDPQKSLPYTISVTPIHTEYLASQDKYFEVLDSNNTITFTATAKRSVMTRVSASDFSATADMEKVEFDEKTGNYRVPVTITNNKYSATQLTITAKNPYLQIVLEDMGRIQKTITADTRGNVATGCALGDVHVVGSNLLKITGPSALVSQVDTVRGTINVDNMSQDVTDSVVPVLYDAQGNPMDTTKLTLSMSTVTVEAQILNTKDVTVEVNASGKPADGYMVTGISNVPESVKIKGEAAVLNPINKITIPEDVLNIAGANANLETTIDISAYLPQDTALVNNSDAKIHVTVRIEPIVKRTFEVPVSRITVLNLRDNYRVEFGVEAMTVEIAGSGRAMASFSEGLLRGTIDAEGLYAGHYNLPVEFELDETKYQTTAVVQAPVIITYQGSDNSGGQAPPQTGGQPEGSEQPGDTQQPGENQTPGDTQQPEGSEQPGDTQQPGENQTPGDTQQQNTGQ